jgi:hypothetical protein
MISAARSREPGRRVATTATRSFVPESVPRVRSFSSTRATTACRSFLGERRPLPWAVGTSKFYRTRPADKRLGDPLTRTPAAEELGERSRSVLERRSVLLSALASTGHGASLCLQRKIARYALVGGGVRPKGHDHLPALWAQGVRDHADRRMPVLLRVSGLRRDASPTRGRLLRLLLVRRQALPAAATRGLANRQRAP